MEQKVIAVEPVGVIHPPVNTPPLTPEEAAKDSRTVTMVFDKPVLLTVTHDRKIQFLAGPQEVPAELVDHWYLKANGVRPYARPVNVGEVATKKK